MVLGYRGVRNERKNKRFYYKEIPVLRTVISIKRR
jgi:hypothetical protein